MDSIKFLARLRSRFLNNVEIRDGHWFWTGLLNPKDGYGLLWVGKNYERAHRVAWKLFKGPIPDDIQVLHKCDIPPCVSPDCLFLGTHDDNMKDKVAKGRWNGPVRKRVTKQCKYCGIDFEVPVCRAETARFCSVSHKTKKENPVKYRWKRTV